jgi:hypothetical protein
MRATPMKVSGLRTGGGVGLQRSQDDGVDEARPRSSELCISNPRPDGS